MMNPKKFGSLHLDIYNSTYEFLKHAFKSVKTNKKSKNTQTNRWGPLVSRTHTSATLEQRRCFVQLYLTGGEITGDDSDTNVFPMISLHLVVPFDGPMVHWSTLAGGDGGIAELCSGTSAIPNHGML